MKKIIIILSLMLFSGYTTKNQNLKLQTDIVYLYSETLSQIKEMKKIEKLKEIFYYISIVETNSDPKKYNYIEDAAGIIQTRPIMVKEVNNILGYNKYTLDDRWCKDKSFEMFKIYQDFVNPEYDEELAARFWNGGRTGDKKTTTNIYVEKYFKIKNEHS